MSVKLDIEINNQRRPGNEDGAVEVRHVPTWKVQNSWHLSKLIYDERS